MSLLFSHDAVTGTARTACDASAWALEEECEREIGGNPVVGISGSVVSVSKDVTFDKAKAGVERFARKNGASVARAREIGDGYEFTLSKRIAEDAAFLAGEKVKFIKGELNGKVGEYVRELGIGTHIVKVDGVERRCSSGEFRVYSAALGDSAEAEDAANGKIWEIRFSHEGKNYLHTSSGNNPTEALNNLRSSFEAHGGKNEAMKRYPYLYNGQTKITDVTNDSAEAEDAADDVTDGNGKPIRVGGKVQVEPSQGWHIKTPWGLAVGKVAKILPNKRVEVDFGQGDKAQINATACVCVDAADAACDSRPDVKASLAHVASTLVGIINIFKRGIAENVTSAEKSAVDDLVSANEKIQSAIRAFG